MQAVTQRWADGKDIYSFLKASHWGIKFKTLHYQPSAQNNSWRRTAKVPIFSDIYSYSATFNFQLIQAVKNHILHSSEYHAPPECQVDCFTAINVTQLFQERKWRLTYLTETEGGKWVTVWRTLPASCELIKDCQTGNPVHYISFYYCLWPCKLLQLICRFQICSCFAASVPTPATGCHFSVPYRNLYHTSEAADTSLPWDAMRWSSTKYITAYPSMLNFSWGRERLELGIPYFSCITIPNQITHF